MPNAFKEGFAASQQKDKGFQFTIQTDISIALNTEFILPIENGTYINDIEVDWGDGNIETLSSGDYTAASSKHTYASVGTYTIKITSESGRMPAIEFGFIDAAIFFRSSRQVISIDTKLLECYSGLSPYIEFVNTFDSCRNVLSIPSRVFDNNLLITELRNSFLLCESLLEIPSDLFDNLPLVTNFSGCFDSCNALTSIPSGLFDNNPLAEDFGACFEDCNSITTIPSDLFDNNLLVDDFGGTFEGLLSITGDLPELWITHAGTSTTADCFLQCNTADNFGDVPAAWL